MQALRTQTGLRLRDRFDRRALHDFMPARGMLPPDRLQDAVMNGFVPARLPRRDGRRARRYTFWMTHTLACFRCGASLASLSLPLSRRDECPECSASLYVCRMCRHFDPAAVNQCREDDAEEVRDKERVNFCEWFVPAENAFDPAGKAAADRAKQSLDALFGGGDAPADRPDSAVDEAEKLFRS